MANSLNEKEKKERVRGGGCNTRGLHCNTHEHLSASETIG